MKETKGQGIFLVHARGHCTHFVLLTSSSLQLQRIAGAVQAVCDAAAVGPPGRASGRRLLLGDAALRQGGLIICLINLIITIIVLMPCPGECPRHGGAVRAAAVAVHEHAGRAGGVAAQRNLPSQPAHGAQWRGPGGRGRYC